MASLDLTPLFSPRRVLLVGASEQSLFSAGIARFLLKHGYGDRLVMVNAKGREVYGRPTHTTIADAAVDGPFDLAIVVIPAAGVGRAIGELGAIGCRLAIIESAGFAEIGGEGVARQAELQRVAAECGVRLMGPNCVGVVDTATGFASTEVLEDCLAPGGTALIAQSGVFGSILLDAMVTLGLRLSKAITLGNRVDLNEADFLEFLADDPNTRVVAMYLEGVADGPRFLRAVRACSAKKPVLVLKSGRTPDGVKAVGSHTASLAGDDAVFSGALRQAGGIRVDTLEQLTDAALAFAHCPPPTGTRVAMITTSGSQGILATDTMHDLGLRLAELSPQTLERMRALTPDWVPIGNPLDLGPSGVYAQGVTALLADPNVDALIIMIAVPWAAIRPAFDRGLDASYLLGDLDALREAARRKPVLVSHLGYPRFTKLVAEAVGDFLPIYPTSERATWALGTLSRFRTGSKAAT